MDYNDAINTYVLDDLSSNTRGAIMNMDNNYDISAKGLQSHLTELGFTPDEIKATRLFDDANPSYGNASDDISYPITYYKDKLNGVNNTMNDTKDYISSIESKGDYNAFNKDSQAFGKYQITPIMMKDMGVTRKDLATPETQEKFMDTLVNKYESRLKQFNLPVNKENIFVVHNLGLTGGIRVLKGNPTKEDISNMKNQLPKDLVSDNEDVILNNYKVRYNIS